jgi:hypothetical protein
MAQKNTRRNIVTRCLAAMALLFVYFVSTSAVLVGTSTTAALARGGRGGGGWGRGGGYGRGGGWGRGRGYGRGYGYGGVYVAPAVRGGCYYSYRWGRTICRGYPY